MFLLGIRFNLSDASFAIITSLSSFLFSSCYFAAIDRNFPRDVVKENNIFSSEGFSAELSQGFSEGFSPQVGDGVIVKSFNRL